LINPLFATKGSSVYFCLENTKLLGNQGNNSHRDIKAINIWHGGQTASDLHLNRNYSN